VLDEALGELSRQALVFVVIDHMQQRTEIPGCSHRPPCLSLGSQRARRLEDPDACDARLSIGTPLV